MEVSSPRTDSPVPSPPPAILQVQTNTSTQTDNETMESTAPRFVRSSAPSPSPTLSNPPRPIPYPGLEPTPSIYSPRPQPFVNSTAGSTRSTSPIGVGPTRSNSPVRLVDEDEPLVPEASSSPVLTYAVPVPVPVGERVAVFNANASVEAETEPDQTHKTKRTWTMTITTTLTPRTGTSGPEEGQVTPMPGTSVTPRSTGSPETQPRPHPEVETGTHIPSSNTPDIAADDCSTPNYIIFRSLPYYGFYPPYGHGLFLRDVDMEGYTLTGLSEDEGYWPPHVHGVIDFRMGSWVFRYRYTSRDASNVSTGDMENSSRDENTSVDLGSRRPESVSGGADWGDAHDDGW